MDEMGTDEPHCQSEEITPIPHERGERGTPPSSPLRFGAFALGQHAGMQFASLIQMLGFATHFAYPTNVVRNDER